MTGPVERFARQIAGHGYIVAAPSSYHEFTGPEALAYDGPGTDAGNAWKVEKKLSAYDEDATLSIDCLAGLSTCNGRIGATGMCLGGHLAFRCAFDKRVRAAVCYFATDIHSHSLGKGKEDDSLQRVKEIKGELVMVRLRSLLSTQNCFSFPELTRQPFRYLASVTTTFHPPAVISSARRCTIRASLSASTNRHGLSTRSSATSCRRAGTTLLSPASVSRCCSSYLGER